MNGRGDSFKSRAGFGDLGTMERIRVLEAVKMVMEMTGHEAEIRLLRDMPTGPVNRVADNSLATRLLGWEPAVPFREGLRRTIDWYFAHKDRDEVRRVMDAGGAIARKVPA